MRSGGSFGGRSRHVPAPLTEREAAAKRPAPAPAPEPAYSARRHPGRPSPARIVRDVVATIDRGCDVHRNEAGRYTDVLLRVAGGVRQVATFADDELAAANNPHGAVAEAVRAGLEAVS